jgi:Homeodomain-like domain
MALQLRQLSPEEQETIEKFAHSRTASARLVERARIIQLAHQGRRVPAIAQPLQLTAITVRTWFERFNAAGCAGYHRAAGVFSRRVTGLIAPSAGGANPPSRITAVAEHGRQPYHSFPIIQLMLWALEIMQTVWRMPLYRRAQRSRRGVRMRQLTLFDGFAE